MSDEDFISQYRNYQKYQIGLVNPSLKFTDDPGPLFLKWCYGGENRKTISVASRGNGKYEWNEELNMCVALTRELGKSASFVKSISTISVHSQIGAEPLGEIGWVKLDLAKYAPTSFCSHDLELEVNRNDENASLPILSFTLDFRFSPLTETEDFTEIVTEDISDLSDDPTEVPENANEITKDLNLVEMTVTEDKSDSSDDPTEIPEKANKEITKDSNLVEMTEKALVEEEERKKHQAKYNSIMNQFPPSRRTHKVFDQDISGIMKQMDQHRKNATKAAQLGMTLSKTIDSLHQIIHERDEKIKKLKKTNSDIREQIGQRDEVIGRLTLKQTTNQQDDSAIKILKDTIQKLKSEINNQKEQNENDRQYMEKQFLNLEHKYKMELEAQKKQIQTVLKRDQIPESVKRLLNNLEGTQDYIACEEEHEERANIKHLEELRHERNARLQLQADLKKSQEELHVLKEEYARSPLPAKKCCNDKKHEILPLHTESDCNSFDQDQKIFEIESPSPRGSVSSLEKEHDQLKILFDDREKKMVEKKYQVQILQTKIRSFINAWNGATEESESLRQEIQVVRDQLRFEQSQVKELKIDVSNREEEIAILKNHHGNGNPTEDQIKLLEKNLALQKTRSRKSTITLQNNIICLQQNLKKKTHEMGKLKMTNRKMKSLQKELARTKTENLYLNEIINSFEIKLINKMDMEHNYDKMSEELAFKTVEIRKLELQRMALEDVLRTTDIDGLLRHFNHRKKKSCFSSTFPKLSVWKQSDKLVDKVKQAKQSDQMADKVEMCPTSDIFGNRTPNTDSITPDKMEISNQN